MADEVLRLRTVVVPDDGGMRRVEAGMRRIGQATKGVGQEAKEATAAQRELQRAAEAAASSVDRWVRRIISAETLRRAAAGFANVTNQMVELKYASKELGMSERDILAWQKAAERVGISGARMVQSLQGFRDVAQGLRYNVGGVRDELIRMGAGPVVRQLMNTSDHAERLRIAFQFKDTLMRDDPSGFKARFFFEQIQMGADAARLTLEQYQKQQEKNKELTQEEKERMEKAHDALKAMGEQWDKLVRTATITFAPILTPLIWALEKSIKLTDELIRKWIKDLKPVFDAVDKEAIEKGWKPEPKPGQPGGPPRRWPFPWFKPTSFGDGGMMPGVENAVWSDITPGAGGADEPERAIEEGTFKALVRFQGYAMGGGVPGGGLMNAAYTPGGAGGGGFGGGGGLGGGSLSGGGGPSPGGTGPAVTGQGESPPGQANVRTNNPGAAAFSPMATRYGGTPSRTGTGHSIAQFPSPVQGAAYNMSLLMRGKNFVGKTLEQAMRAWSGGARGAPAGYDPNMVITEDFMRDPGKAIPLMKAITAGEGKGRYPMDEEQWSQAHKWALENKIPEGETPLARKAPASPQAPAPGEITGQSPYGGRVEEQQSRVAAVRRGAIDQRLRTALDYASAQTGYKVVVTSGGQRMPGAERATGTHRHDKGHAGDFHLVDEKGNMIPSTDPRAARFMEYAAEAGVRGGGASYGTMGRFKIHGDLGTHGGPYGPNQAIRDAITRGMRTRQARGGGMPPLPTARIDSAIEAQSAPKPKAEVKTNIYSNGKEGGKESSGPSFADTQVHGEKQMDGSGGIGAR